MRHLNQEIVASIPETSAGSELDIFADDATVHQNFMNGLHGSLIDGHLRIVCNYANEWHQRKDPTRNYTGVGKAQGGPLAGGRPLFYVADVDNNGVPYANPSPDQFWMMRYLFIPVYMPPKDAGVPHAALLVVSPVTKTLEFLDSDNTPVDTNYTNGLVGRVMQWMSTFLDNPDNLDAPQFIPEEWRFRDSRANQQNPASSDCGVFVLTHAQFLAFGYDRSQSERQNWPPNFATSLVNNDRRFRITADITGGGLPAPFFTFFNPDFRLNHIQNHQYYPILDTPPVLAGRTWRMYRDHPQFGTLLTAALRNRRSCYVGCRYKTWLAKHCQRNLRFYPLYSRHCGRNRSSRQFREWVELMDQNRRSGAFQPRAFDRNGSQVAWPRTWIDPRDPTTVGQCKAASLLGPLW
ncbi:hypothetical protein J7T55_000139 [Diaporthe amygdali]|uniref:uncharacterized protein n=1 Tax=Phomopsis amygdali TaxID=1214568 RepID=UPI0022FE14B8|nr:uncharacterized protein J7T55_000139 [Diaporthe amygdali]KAJ0108174.1 hypothetical protein J7T55_000139 [Diaporthe amygdali]